MKKLWLWLSLGLIFKLVLIPAALHPDFRAVNLAGYFIAQKGQILSFYDTLSRLPRTDRLVNLYGDNIFIYPPLSYLTHAVFNKLFYPVCPQTAFWTLIDDIGRLRSTAGFMPLMYLLKLPYLLADILCLYLLWHYLPEAKRRRLIWLWWFNPVVIYTCYLMGQFDIFVALFILLALIYSGKKSWLSAVFLGIGAGFKPFPLFLLPFLPGNKLRNLVLGIGAYVLLIAPYLSSPAFKQYALLASQSDKMLFAKIMISGSQYLPVFLIGLILLFWWNYYHPQKFPLWVWLCTPLLLFYSVTHFHPQWFVWVMPLLVAGVAARISLVWPYAVLLISYFVIVLLFEPSLNFGLFGSAFWLNPLLNRFISVDLLSSIARAILAGSAVAVIMPETGKNG